MDERDRETELAGKERTRGRDIGDDELRLGRRQSRSRCGSPFLGGHGFSLPRRALVASVARISADSDVHETFTREAVGI